jgi:hypothetical protein
MSNSLTFMLKSYILIEIIGQNRNGEENKYEEID